MAYETLIVEARATVAWLTLNRPGVLNALNATMTRELADALGALDADPAVRAIVLTGAGRGFCSGADVAGLSAAASGAQTGPSANRRRMRQGPMRLATTLLALETPVIAAVNGPCAGAGFGIALAADFVVARRDAVFSVTFVRRGLVPDYATTFLLPRVCGLRVARELCLLGDRVSAEEGRAAGFVHQVVAEEAFADAVTSLAQRLAAGAGMALALTKRLLLQSFETDSAVALEREFAAQALCFATNDAREGAAAFTEKRDPEFTGT